MLSWLSICHSLSILALSIYCQRTLKKANLFSKKQYYMVMILSVGLTVSYLALVCWCVMKSFSMFDEDKALEALDEVMQVAKEVERNFSLFMFSVLFNLLLIFCIMGLNFFSAVMTEHLERLNELRFGINGPAQTELNHLGGKDVHEMKPSASLASLLSTTDAIAHASELSTAFDS